MTDIHPAEFGRVAVLMGGRSSEREISLQSGNAVLDSLKASGVDAFGIDYVEESLEIFRDEKIDRVFIMLHGRLGEDGTVQGAMELLGMPYTGSGVLASSLAMDKTRAKKIWSYDGLPTPPWFELDDDTDFEHVIAELGTVFVKPVNEGSSIGISRAETPEALAKAWHAARRYDSRVLAERWIQGPEFSVPILDGKALPVVGLETGKEFYDYEAKYLSDQTRYLCPAPLSAEKTRAIQDIAVRAWESLGCRAWGRADVMQGPDGRFYLLEMNTVPGMTSHSLVPMSARQAGYTFDSLVLQILASTLDGGRD